MICPRLDCKLKGIDQSADQFVSANRTTKLCLTCRKAAQEYNRRKRSGQTDTRHGGQASQVTLRQTRPIRPGEPPRFAFEGEEKMYRQWLKELCQNVERN